MTLWMPAASRRFGKYSVPSSEKLLPTARIRRVSGLWGRALAAERASPAEKEFAGTDAARMPAARIDRTKVKDEARSRLIIVAFLLI